jgi:hypothetical protein
MAQIQGILALESKASDGANHLRTGEELELVVRWPHAAGFAGQKPDNDDWAFGRFVLRVPGGIQTTVPTDELLKNGRVALTLQRGGAHLFALCMGPVGRRSSHAWSEMTYCSKMVVDIDDGSGQRTLAAADLTTKIGQSLEIVPYRPPRAVKVGDDLPLRFYVHGRGVTHQRVEAIAPDGTRVVTQTNAHGLADFRIDRPGPWIFRMVVQDRGQERVAELVMTLAQGGAA